jgi:chaperonin GroES
MNMKINVFPGRLLVKREPIHTMIINPKGLQLRKNKGVVLDCRGDKFKIGDDVFFMARRGTYLDQGEALIDESDVIMCNMKLLGERVLIEPIKEKNETETGLVTTVMDIPPMRGIVRVVGEDMPVGKDGKPKVNEGDEVFFRREAGIILEKDGLKMIVLKISDVIAVL